MEKRPVAYQLYSARDDAAKDLDGVLHSLKDMGYAGIELAGFYGYTVDYFKETLDKYGLKAISSHVPFNLIEEDMFKVISDHKKLGCEYIAVPYLDDEHRPGSAGFAHSIAVMYKFARLMKEAGMTLLYHNHDFEFVEVCGQFGLDFLYSAIPEDLLKTQLDLCWVKYAGQDPVAYLKKYAGRAPVVHLKDYYGVKRDGATPYALIGLDEDQKKDLPAFEFRPFGHGCQDAKACVEAGIDAGALWFVIEQDQSVGRTPLEAAAMSIQTLKDLGLTD